jgi:hypothetical protein
MTTRSTRRRRGLLSAITISALCLFGGILGIRGMAREQATDVALANTQGPVRGATGLFGYVPAGFQLGPETGGIWDGWMTFGFFRSASLDRWVFSGYRDFEGDCPPLPSELASASIKTPADTSLSGSSASYATGGEELAEWVSANIGTIGGDDFNVAFEEISVYRNCSGDFVVASGTYSPDELLAAKGSSDLIMTGYSPMAGGMDNDTFTFGGQTIYVTREMDIRTGEGMKLGGKDPVKLRDTWARFSENQSQQNENQSESEGWVTLEWVERGILVSLHWEGDSSVDKRQELLNIAEGLVLDTEG